MLQNIFESLYIINKQQSVVPGHVKHLPALELSLAGVALGHEEHLPALELGLAGVALGHEERLPALELGLQ